MADNDELKARMRDALAKKGPGGQSWVTDGGHHKGGGPASRGRQGGSREFRRKAGG